MTVGISAFDVSGHLESGVALEVGYRAPWRLYRRIRPGAGLMFAPDGAGYGYLGVQLPIPIRSGISLTPSFGGGILVGRQSDDLGSAVEFRSGIDLGFDWSDESSLLLTFYHLSNGGLGRTNPGMEVLVLGYSFGL